MECVRMELGPPDRKGRRLAPADPRFQFPAFVRHGDPFHRPVPATRLPLRVPRYSPDGWRVDVHPSTGQTTNPRYFAGGDCVNGGREVVDAVAEGKRAAARRSPALPVSGGPAVADLTTRFAGIESPESFLARFGPPTNCGDQVARAFDAGWGGAVWKTIGEPIVNVVPLLVRRLERRSAMMGLNNIELITDRPIEANLREIAEVKKKYPKHAVIASLMVESPPRGMARNRAAVRGCGADGLELNFGCPHGMSERGMGSAVGQVPQYRSADHGVGEGGRHDACAGEAHSQR